MSKSLLKTTSHAALIAIAGLMTVTAAQAADLGGNCCADLEERIAELEATAARKGNRKVSLTVYGQVHESVIFWSDGQERNAYVVSNNTSRTAFGFRGSAKITNDVSAGYLLELGVRYATSSNRNQTADKAGGNDNNLDIRHSAWYVDSKSLGRVWVGKTSTATDGITEINLANRVNGANNVSYWNGGYLLRNNGVKASALTWGSLYSQGTPNVAEGDRLNTVRYITPTFAGFIASAAWSEDDRVDAALRYAGEFSGIRLAAGIGYQKMTDFNNGDGNQGCSNPGAKTAPTGTNFQPTGNAAISDTNCTMLGMSASVMHVPTGLFVTGAYGEQKDNRMGAIAALTGANHPSNDKSKFFSIQAGIEQKFFGLGKTTMYGEYMKMNQGNGLATGQLRVIAANDAINTSGANSFIASSETKVWGVGINQAIDAAAADIYLNYRNYAGSVNTVNAAGAAAANTGFKDFQAVMTGMVIKF
jgi:hypothetical protein